MAPGPRPGLSRALALLSRRPSIALYSPNPLLLQQLRMTHSTRPESIQIKWITKDGKEHVKPAAIGDTLLEAAHRQGMPVEGACEGVCACSTCHVILEREVYDNLPEPSETEEDMLDQAFGQTATSRLGCQVTLQAEHNNITVRLPKATRNFYVVSHS
jgi:ferredoxin-2, mitochondrial